MISEFEALHNIAILSGMGIGVVLFFGLFLYFLPIIISFAYGQCKIGLILANIFLGITPLPWVILILNIIEDNKGIDKIQLKISKADKKLLLLLTQQKEQAEISKLFKKLVVNHHKTHKDKENQEMIG